ncbi:MAG: NUDIX hydrolase [Candidatus Eremiobacteraeota bacterium]|nr:NUDIX hydrolase [Candidatus Eremiobacteraeota bacterium]
MDPYTRNAFREIYRNPWLAVEVHDMVHPNGVFGEHLLVVPPRPVAVLVEDGDDFILTRQPRFAARREVVEVVKGGAGENETPLDAAKRELREELGIVAAHWEPLGEIYEIPSIVANPIAMFLAGSLTHVESAQEDVESIEPLRIAIDDMLGGAAGLAIEDAVTLAILFRYLMRA